MRTLFVVQVKFKTSLPRALPHIYPKLSCLHLTLDCLLVLAHTVVSVFSRKQVNCYKQLFFLFFRSMNRTKGYGHC